MQIIKIILLIICLGLPFLLTFINRKLWHKRFGNLALFLISCVLTWLLIQGIVQLIDWYLQYQLDKFDVNHDGNFSQYEITPQQEQALNAVVNDTGRSLAPITGAIFSVVYNLMVFGMFAFVECVNAKKHQ